MHIKRLLFTSLFLMQGLYAYSDHIDKYLEYLSSPNFGRIGNYKKGEMQIVENYDAILQVQKNYYDEFIRKGLRSDEAEKYSRVGVVEEDNFWLWLRDPLILPNGKTTAYNRLFPKSGLNGAAGVSVMGISKENKVLVNIIFRHATREWEIELPRGGRQKKETSAQAALRELKEETGVQAKNPVKIASIASDSGVLTNILDVFVVKDLLITNNTDREECEAIHDCIFVSKQMLKQAFVDGFIEIEIQGNKMKAFCRDAFLASALLIAETKSLL